MTNASTRFFVLLISDAQYIIPIKQTKLAPLTASAYCSLARICAANRLQIEKMYN